MPFGWEWHKSLPVKGKFTKINKNVKYALKCSLNIPGDINKLLVTMIQHINVWTHLAPTGHN